MFALPSPSLHPALRSLLAPLFGLMLSLSAMPALAQGAAQGSFKPVPALTAHVTDEVGMLAPDQRQRLDAALADYERQTGSQIAVLLVASTEPEAIEQYSIRVTDAWKLGRKGVDDGVLLLVARDNPKALRRLRIEAGRGVQGVLTDAQSKRILQDVIAPHFRQNDYYGGLVAGVGAIEGLLHQDSFPAPANGAAAQGAAQADAQADAQAGGPGIVGSLFFIIIGIVVLRSMFRPRSSRFGRLGRGGVGNGWSSGAAGFVLGNILSGSRGGVGGGFSGGGSSGGFSGGGGSFDGGGASGDW